jgi:UDP-4-amino-4-deoxy-L-arabinose formyltransferase/UDP-glucuronic acid dehydrogenase (UDP-4-keto-hexauronic acid decarboxylating)
MADELDAGPVLMKRALALSEYTYIGDVYAFLEEVVPEMFAKTLSGLEDGTVEPREQPADPSQSLRCYPRRPSDGRIDWGQPAELIARLVRASAEPFAGAYSYLEGTRVTVWRARSEPLAQPSLGVPGQIIDRRPETGEVSVLTDDGQLVIEVISTDEGDERVTPTEILRSTRQRLGAEPRDRVPG